MGAEYENVEEVIEEENISSAKAVYDWLTGLGTGGTMKVALHRKYPTMHQGFPCGGKIDSYDGPVTEEEIAEMHGGGKFQIVVHRANPRAGQKGQPPTIYAGARTFEIAGLPKLENLIGYEDSPQAHRRSGGNGESEGSAAQVRALSMAENLVRSAQDRADRIESKSGNDWRSIEAMMAPLRDQITGLTEALAAKDRQIAEIINRPQDTSTQKELIEMYRDSNTDHASRLLEIRTAHDSELRQLREFNREEIRSREARFEKELDAIRAAATREIDTLRQTHAQALESQKQAYEMRIEALRDIISRGEREVTKAETELVTLRAKKDVGITDQINNLAAIKQGLSVLMPDAPDEGPQMSGWEKALAVISNNPIVQAATARAMGAITAGGQPQQMVTVKRSDGKLVQVPASYAHEQQQAAAAEQGTPPAAVGAADPADIARAIQFLETAFRNGIDPTVVAASARNLVPDNVLQLLKSQGVDHFLNNVAQLDNSSPLATAEGRMYVRQIAKFLLEGTTDIVEEDEEEPSDDEVDIDDDDSPVEND